MDRVRDSLAGGWLLGTSTLLLILPISCHCRVLGSVGVPTPLVSCERPSMAGDEVPTTPAPLLTRLAQVSSAPDSDLDADPHSVNVSSLISLPSCQSHVVYS